jgi:hypothetical protein
LNFTVTAAVKQREQFFAGQCGTVGGGCAYARHSERGVFGDDLLDRHAGGQAVQEHLQLVSGRYAGPAPESIRGREAAL